LNKGLLGKVKISIAILSAILVIFSLVNFVLPSFAEGATIWTDKPDYTSGETVLISGSGFVASSPLSVSVTRPDSSVESCTDSSNCNSRFLNGPLTSDSSGSFSEYQYTLNGILGTYTVDVSDGTNNAQTTFTDSRTIDSAKLNNANSVTVPPSASITAAVTVTTTYTDGSSSNDWKSTKYLIESLSSVCIDHGDHTFSGIYTESFTITAPATVGVYDVSFWAYNNDACSSGTSAEKKLVDGITVVPGASLNPLHDTYVIKSEPSSGHDDKDLHVKWGSGDDNKRRSYLKFDLSGIPDGATIKSAVLRLYQFTAAGTDTMGVYKVSNDKTTGGAWTETDLTWDNAPIDWSTGATTSVGSSDGYKELTVATGDVQSALSGDILSLAVKFSTESSSKHHDFCDMEGTDSGNNCGSTTKPELVITYTVPSAVCGNGIKESGEDCDPGASNPADCCSASCKYELNSYVCRAAAPGGCDVAEQCSGSSADCPADVKRPSGYDCGTCAACDGSGSCIYDSSQNNDCGFCYKCTAKDTCGYQSSSEDVKCECPDGQCVTGFCNGAGACGVKSLSTPCEKDGLFCTVDHCDGSGSCVYWKPYDCSGWNLPEIAKCDNNPDNRLETFDYAAAVAGVCNEAQDKCDYGTYSFTYTCADSSSADGGPVVPVSDDIRTCTAECDGFGTECQPHITGDICYYDSSCNTNSAVCACGAYSQEYCPATGTEYEGNCYYGTKDCVNSESSGGCTLNVDPMGCYDKCDSVLGPIDTIGPDTYNTKVKPDPTNAKINITSTTEDSCNNIQKAEYYINECGTPGSGTMMDSSDGAYDEKKEDVNKTNVDVSHLPDGRHFICVRGKDIKENWGDCDCVGFDLDKIAPQTVIQNITPYMACGNNPYLWARICDPFNQSFICNAEYFIDVFTGIPGSGIPMNAIDGKFNESACEDVEAWINIDPLSEGTHYVKVSGHDCACNWGKLSALTPVSFIKDTTAPTTTKTVGEPKHECTVGENASYGNPADGCWYINQSTMITLTAQDYNPGNNEYSDNEKIYYRYRVDGVSWTNWILYSGPFHFTEDSVHELEYFANDSCGNAETVHHEVDIVDTKPPILTKTLGLPRLSVGAGEWYINQSTMITLSCVDDNPHPSDHVTIYYRYNVDGGSYTGWITYTGPFHFTEDSRHDLEVKCVDILGNVAGPQIEHDYVDTVPPTTTKTYGTPFFSPNGNVTEWINSSTPITLSATDGGAICAAGVDKIYWRNTLLGNSEACEDPTLCQQQTGTGSFTEYAGPFYKTEDSCHLIEYYSVDKLGNVEPVKKQCVFVDNKGPLASKTLGSPKHMCEGAEECDYYINQSTMISVSCSDQNPHPVGTDKAYYRYNVDGGAYTNWILYTDPFHFTEDSAHQLQVQCVDKLGNIGPVFIENDIVDSQPPVTTKTFDGPNIAGDGFMWITQNTNIVLSCVDPNPHPVDHTTIYYRYNVDGGGYTNWLTYSVPFHFTEDSVHTLQYYCVDQLGNTEATHTEIDRVDSTAPTTTKTYGTPTKVVDDYRWINSSTPITLTATDGGEICAVGVDKLYWKVTNLGTIDPETCSEECGYSHGSSAWNESSTNVTFTIGEESCHLIEYYSKDKLGNIEPTHNQCVFVDNTPPVTSKDVGDPKVECTAEQGCDWFIKADQTQITLTCADVNPHPVGSDYIKYRYNVDGGAWTNWMTYEAPFTFPEESLHTLQYYCVDKLGNTEETKVEKDNVDNTPPVITDTRVDDCAVHSGTGVKIFTHVTDAKVGVGTVTAHIQKPDGHDVATVILTYNSTSGYYEGTWTSGWWSWEGTYYIDIVASDLLDNTATQNNGAFVNVDNTKPHISWVFSGKDWVGYGTTFYVAAEVSDNSFMFKEVCEPEIICSARIVDNLGKESALDGSLVFNKTIGKCTGFVTVNETFDESPANLYVDTWDNAGNYKDNVYTIIGIDNTPPVKVSFETNPGQDSPIKSEQRIWYNITFKQDMSGIMSPCYISINETRWDASPIIGNKCSGYYDVPNGLSDGTVRFMLKVEDTAGNWLEDSINFGLDNSPPEKKILSPEDGGYYGVDLQINVSLKDIAGVDTETVQYRIFEPEAWWNFLCVIGVCPYSSGWLDLTLTEGNQHDGNYTAVFDTSGLTSGKTYMLQIIGCDVLYSEQEIEHAKAGINTSHCSDPQIHFILDLDPPIGPSNVKIKELTITWDAATDALSGVSYYKIYHIFNDSYKEIVHVVNVGDALTFKVNESGTYGVSAVDKVNNEGKIVIATEPEENVGYSYTGGTSGGGGGGLPSTTEVPSGPSELTGGTTPSEELPEQVPSEEGMPTQEVPGVPSTMATAFFLGLTTMDWMTAIIAGVVVAIILIVLSRKRKPKRR